MDKILNKCLHLEKITKKEALEIYNKLNFTELTSLANEIRHKLNPGNNVGWIIDRNINTTNICNTGCKFCNFWTTKNKENAYITSIDEYIEKIETLHNIGGNQLLLQGGMIKEHGLSFYKNIFQEIKNKFPNIKLHALGPPEIHHIAKIENKSYKYILEELIKSGLDSLPGAGAEILVERVRKIISPAKCTVDQWLEVMKEAHKLNLITSATMMAGHVETLEERIEHLIKIRNLQDEKSKSNYGFLAFIPWTFQRCGTLLDKKHEIKPLSSKEYIKLIAISRIVLNNIKHIQPSWLTVGKETAQLCLHAGADDFGSIMIEENVVSSAGANNSFNKEGIQKSITEAGFTPYQRDQEYKEFSWN